MSTNLEKQRRAVEAARREEAEKQIQVSNVKTRDAILEEFNLAELEAVDVKHKNMKSTIKGSGCVTIINHDKCGRRVHLANSIWRDLDCPQFVKVFLKSQQMFVMDGGKAGIAVKFDRTMPFEDAVKDYNGKIVLYATETVKRVTADWELQFDSSCCYTGGTYKKCIISGVPAVVISKEDAVEETDDSVDHNIANAVGDVK